MASHYTAVCDTLLDWTELHILRYPWQMITGFQIPPYLAKRMQDGETILFLGAGASAGSKNAAGMTPPLGGTLAQILSEAYGTPLAPGDKLSAIAHNAKRKLGDQAYFKLLRKNYQNCTPSDSLKVLARYHWPRVYTTNIDDATDAAFRDSNGGNFEVLIHSSPVGLPATGSQLVKLNGSIDRLDAGLIFTKDEYSSYFSSYSSWYAEMARDFQDRTFVFIGTQLDEPLFEHHVYRLTQASGLMPGESFIICPDFSANMREHLTGRKIIPLEGTLEDFTAALPAVLGHRTTLRDITARRYPSLFAHISSRVIQEAMADNPDETRNLTLVARDALESNVPPDKTAVRKFYFGQSPTWRDILDGVAARLQVVSEITRAVLSETFRRILVSGPAGTGKTTCAMMAALEVAEAGAATVLWIDSSERVPMALLRAFANEPNTKLVIFVDNFGRHADAIKLLFDTGIFTSSMTVVLCDRSNIVERSQASAKVQPDKTVKITKFQASDVDLLLDRVEKFGPWERLARMQANERHELLQGKSEKVLLVALREATSGRGYDELISSEFQDLTEGVSRDVALLVSIAAMHGLNLSRRTLLGALEALHPSRHDIPSPDLGVADVVLNDGNSYRMRHTMIADYIVTSIVQPPAALAAVRALLLSLSRFSSPLRKHAKREAPLLAWLLNHEFLWTRFRSDKNQVVAMFREAETWFRDDALFWLQYALFEQRADYLRDAMNHVRFALDGWPDSYQILNGYANIHIAAAMSASGAEDALRIMEDSCMMLREQMKDPATEPHAVVGYCKGKVKVLAKWAPNRLEREVPVLTKMLKDAVKKYPGNTELSGLKANLNHLILQHRLPDRSESSLRQTPARGGAKKRGAAPTPSGKVLNDRAPSRAPGRASAKPAGKEAAKSAINRRRR